MHNNLSSCSPESLKERFLKYPFVLNKIPFIYNEIRSNIPSVGINIPIVRFKARNIRRLGFTLVELVVTMAVAAILITVAVPSLRTMIQNGRLNTQANDLVGDLSLARSEAIKRRAFVGICISTNGTACTGGGNWRDGRAVFVGTGLNGTWQANDLILRFRGPMASAADTLSVSVIGDPIIFSANGASNIIGGPGFFTFCDSRGFTNGKMVNVNSMGQIGVSNRTPAAC